MKISKKTRAVIDTNGYKNLSETISDLSQMQISTVLCNSKSI